jgi:hypothetical protein
MPVTLLSSVWSSIVGSRGDWYLFQQSEIKKEIEKLFKDTE